MAKKTAQKEKGKEDVAAIHGSAPHLAPQVPSLVDAVYEKLFSYDATKRHFVPRQHGYEGAVPESLESLTLDHPMIAFRKQHLGRYLEKLVTRPYDVTMVNYLDLVGKIHTPEAGSKELDVPLVQMNVLMGFVSDALVRTIFILGLDRDTEVRTVRAFNKLLWLQNDLITRLAALERCPIQNRLLLIQPMFDLLEAFRDLSQVVNDHGMRIAGIDSDGGIRGTEFCDQAFKRVLGFGKGIVDRHNFFVSLSYFHHCS